MGLKPFCGATGTFCFGLQLTKPETENKKSPLIELASCVKFSCLFFSILARATVSYSVTIVTY